MLFSIRADHLNQFFDRADHLNQFFISLLSLGALDE